MDRKNFLTALGGSAACICMGGLASCVKATVVPAGTSNQLSIDLNTQLLNVGDYFISGPIAVIRVAPGNTDSSFSVLNTTCPHAGYTVQYYPDPNSPATGEFVCPGHGSVFTQQGFKVSGPTPADLARLSFSVVNTSLVIST